MLFFSSFSSVFLDRLTRVVCVFLYYFCSMRVWLISDLLTWYSTCFQACTLETNISGRFKWEHVEFCSPTTKNVDRRKLFMRNSHRQSQMTLWQRDKLKRYLHYQCLWPLSLVGWWLELFSITSPNIESWLTGKSFRSSIHTNFQTCSQVRSRVKLKILNL